MYGESTTPEEEQVASAIVDATYQVHSQLGPGLLESVYVRCLAYELRKQGFVVETEVPVPIRYDGVSLDEGYRLDLLVNRRVIVEVKSVEKLNPIHPLPTKTYIRLMDLRLGFLINFNVRLIKDGIKRIICTSRKIPRSKITASPLRIFA